jgi:hypothetical protein
MEIAFGLALLAAIYFYYGRYKKTQAARLVDQLNREIEESDKRIASLMAEEVARDLAAGMTIEESADKNAPLYQAMQNRNNI